jgi:hypothetical protein
MKYAAATHRGLGWNAYQQSLNIRLTNLLPIAAQTSRSRADSRYHQAATPRGNIGEADAELTADDLAVIERAEDPEKMIRLIIQEMEETEIEIKASCAATMAARKTADRNLQARHQQAEGVGKEGSASHRERPRGFSPRGADAKASIFRGGE